MAIIFRALRLLSLTIWVGGLVFFAFILAPLAFSTLPTVRDAGMIVGGTLQVLNTVGSACGAVFLIGTITLWLRTEPRTDLRGRRLLLIESASVVLMLAATAVVQHGIVPAMERDRIAAGGDIDAAPFESPARRDFERLHPISEKVEGAVLLLGIANVILIAAERGERSHAQAG